MAALIERFAIWWAKATCRHEFLEARFKIVEEFGYAYEECLTCGREFYE